MTDWGSVRREFPSLHQWTYLNSATYGQLPLRAIEAMNRYFDRLEEWAASDFLAWYDDADRLRESIGRLVHASPDDIAFCGNASSALSWLIGGLDWKPGDRIVTLEHEFPNNLYAPWFAAGVEFAETSWEGFFEAVTPRTRLVVISMLNYATGFRVPLEIISPYLRQRGVLLYVDGTQGVGALEFDCARIQPSMLAVHGYKWLLCPTGAGFAYVAPELRAMLTPAVVGWRSHHRWREVDNLHHGKPAFSENAEKFEGGGLPFTLLYGMGAAVDLQLELGPANVERRVLAMADAARGMLREAGAEVADGPSPIVAGRFERHDVSAIAKKLRERRIVVSARHGHLRVSPHFYNDETDLDRFRTGLRAAL